VVKVMNTGRKIIKMANILFFVILLASIISGIVLAWFVLPADLITTRLIIAAAFIVPGFICAWVTELLLIGFGEMISDIRIIRQGYYKEEPTLSSEKDTTAGTSTKPDKPTVKTNTGKSVEAIYESDSKIRCPECNTTQSVERDYCNKCNVQFK